MFQNQSFSKSYVRTDAPGLIEETRQFLVPGSITQAYASYRRDDRAVIL